MWNNMGGNGGDSGGGYLNSPGYGSSQPASQQQKSRPRTQSNVPCTIAQILRAEASDDSFICDGTPLYQVTLIGIIKSAKEAQTHLLYELDDLSGPLLEVRQFSDNDEGTPEAERTSLVRENVYVRVHGHLRSFSGKRQVIASIVRVVTDMNELTSHLLELTYLRALRATNRSRAAGHASMDTSAGRMGGVRPGQQLGAAAMMSGGGGGAMGGGGGGQMAIDLGLNVQQQQVLNVLRTCTDETGISITFVCERLKGMPQKVIRDAVDFLSSEGHIYSTIDDEHYKATDSM